MPEGDKSRRLAEALSGLLTQSSTELARGQSKPRVAIADGLARYWVMLPPAAVGSLAELQAVVQARCQQLFGSAQRWRIVGDWNARHPFLCAAIPEWIVEAVDIAFGVGSPVAGALPLALSTCASQLPKDGWACLTFPGCTSLLGVATGRLRSLRTLPLDVGATIDIQLARAAQELRRESLRTQFGIDAPVHWWHLGDDSTSAFSTPDLVVEGLRFAPMPRMRALSGPIGTAGRFADAEAAAILAALD
jgi:hypothetical protein